MLTEEINRLVSQNEQNSKIWREKLAPKGIKSLRDEEEQNPALGFERIGLQRSLLRAALESPASLTNELRTGLLIEDVDVSSFPTLENPIPSSYLQKRPPTLAEEVHNRFSEANIDRRQVSVSSFWQYIIIHWLESGTFEGRPADHLIAERHLENLADPSCLSEGNTLTYEQRVYLNDCARDLVANIAGVPHIVGRARNMLRGAVSHMWWAFELSSKASDVQGVTFSPRSALEFLLINSNMRVVSEWAAWRVARLGDPNALAATLEAALGEGRRSQPTTREWEEMVKRFARRTRYLRIDEDSPYRVQQLASLCFD